MQDTAEGFGQPIRQIFEPFFRMQRELPSPFDAAPHYRVVVGDHFWHWLYLPVAGLVERLPAASVVDATGCLATPGLVNTHHHLYQWATRGFAADAGLFDWLRTLYPLWARLRTQGARRPP